MDETLGAILRPIAAVVGPAGTRLSALLVLCPQTNRVPMCRGGTWVLAALENDDGEFRRIDRFWSIRRKDPTPRNRTRVLAGQES